MSIVSGLKQIQAKLKALIREAQLASMKSVAVGYTANYAIYVHENKEMKLKGKPRPKKRGKYWDPQGKAQPKFLEEPARTMQPELARIIKEMYKATGNMEQALLVAGLRLQRESQRLVPVNTGNLKASAFTRVEK